MGLYIYRLEGAALLDGAMYESIEADASVTRQAVLTVLLASLAAGIGATAQFGWHPLTLALTVGVALVTWIAWAVLMFQIGARLLPESATRTDLRELLRTTGFAAGPGILQALAIAAPVATLPIFLLTTVWMCVAMVAAIKHALDYQSTARAIAVVALGALLCVAMALVIALLVAPTASARSLLDQFR